jgi:hypothetical protein
MCFAHLRCSLSNVSVRIDILNFSTLMDVQQLWQTAAHIVTVRTRNFCALARILVGAAYCLLIRCVFTFSEHFVIAWYQSTTTCWVAAQLSGAHIGQHLICLSFLKMLHLKVVTSEKIGGSRVISTLSTWYGGVVMGVLLLFNEAAILYRHFNCAPLQKQNIIVFAANNSRCCECHVAPTIIL